ncbi:ring-cleaving dioxygenase [Acidisphaera rubrifaciens]|uniref:Glyoxalase n=1 Tax=Acidisphaera rubrifaciens HS-AP3 TaxID=1231350 RepID=A0A0D6PBD5_9PROT|nr:ring-cleaving dioxygenase [Acidisphaera rubrifaciens]GAN78164.1 glyoxalase [Acidisphaera rubrifaciens HS-AP3]
MDTPITGLHHVTSGVSGAQEDIDFLAGTIGLRIIKQTVLFDGTNPIYHLYYANRGAEVGSVMTTFPFRKVGYVGRRGSGQVKTTGYSVPRGAVAFWAERFARLGVPHGKPGERFGAHVLRFTHPAGLEFEMIEDADDRRDPWTTADIGADSGVRGFHSVAMSVRDTEEQDRFLTEGLGFKRLGSDGAYTRYAINGGGAGRVIEFLHEPDVKQGTWAFCQGVVHHVALAVPTETEQLAVKARLEGLGYTDCSEIKDRNYFHSIYVRSPGGILVELATCDIGFAVDEAPDHLGEALLLPPWFEDRRAEIVAPLEPITVPRHAH